MNKEASTVWDGQKIRAARLERGFSEEEATKLLEITPVFLTMLERGQRQPSPRTVLKLSTVYRKPLGYFLVDEKNFAIA